MKSFAYARPTNLAGTVSALTSSVRPLAGGTDLLTLMKNGVQEPDRLLDIKRLPELDRDIAFDDGALRLGALVTLTQLEDDPLVAEHAPALAEAAALAASPQLRNMATIGGNILQRPRCWYFRDEEVACWLKGGTDCPARDGDNRHHAIFDQSPCVAVHPSDPATVLVAMEATVHYQDASGAHDLALDRFFAPPDNERRTEHTLPPDAIITAITIPAISGDVRARYDKAMERKVWAFAQVGLALIVTMDGDTVRDARIALGGVANVPWRARGAEAALTGTSLQPQDIERVAEAAIAGATPLAFNRYKVPLAKALIRNGLTELARST